MVNNKELLNLTGMTYYMQQFHCLAWNAMGFKNKKEGTNV